MNRLEHLLTITAEECNEVGQRVAKALRFGLSNTEPGSEMNNMERILQEYTDLIAALEMVGEELKKSEDKNLRKIGFNLKEIHNGRYVEKQTKKNKVEKYFEISRKEGTLK